MSKSFLKIRKGTLFTPLASPPADPQTGDVYFNSTNGLNQYLSSAWAPVGRFAYTTIEVTNQAAYTAAAWEQLIVNTSTTATALTLPSSPALGDSIIIIDGGAGLGSFGTNALTITPGGGATVQGQSSVALSRNGLFVQLVFASTLNDWRILS